MSSDNPLRRASDTPENERVPPLTEEQLQLLSEQTRRATHKAVYRFRNQAVIGFLVLAIGTGVAFKREDTDRANAKVNSTAQRHAIVRSGKTVAVDGCNRDFRTITSLRGVLIASEQQQHAALVRHDITVEQYNRATEFFHDQLANLPLPDCRKAEQILTDKAGARIRVPKPLHP